MRQRLVRFLLLALVAGFGVTAIPADVQDEDWIELVTAGQNAVDLGLGASIRPMPLWIVNAVATVV